MPPDAAPRAPDALARVIVAETEKWAPVVRALNPKAD
jgi:hypothetical protein